jgi:2,4-dienoyl-CoA reductase-like NADH-dependent reductase (Old Yellow Enzyme family)
LKSVQDFRNRLCDLGIQLPCDEALGRRDGSPLAAPVEGVLINGKRIGNRIAVHPMEGWDGTTQGGVTEEMKRRWARFGESGAKLICGGEAMAVRPDGRANPNQLILNDENREGIAGLVSLLKMAHTERYGTVDDLVVGFQLTHSGRFCRPHKKEQWESRVAFRHPLLDAKFQVTSDSQVLSDAEVRELIRDFVRAARVAWEAGADFVDIKHCHGYLLHEFLGAHTRPGHYGGSFENRTRPLREIVEGIRADGNPIGLGVRLSVFDRVPHKPDPDRAAPGKLGPGIPEDFSSHLPYRYGFGVNQENPMETDLSEPLRFVALAGELGIQVLNVTAGSPYYTPHIQRPAAFPPSDGYQPAYDPLIDVVRQLEATRAIRAARPAGMAVVGTGYTYLQEYLPHVAQALVREGWVDIVGLGRMMLSYPRFLADSLDKGAAEPKLICRTFSDCTTAPRNGLISGCYPLDKYYTTRPEAARLKEIKRATGA